MSDLTPEALMTPEVEAARGAIAAKKTDPAFGKLFASGDAAARAEMSRLHVAGYPDAPPAADAPPPAAPPAADAPPADPKLYKLDYAHGQEINRALDTEARGLFHDMGLPQPVAKLASDLLQKAEARESRFTDAELKLQAAASEFKLRSMFGVRYQAKMDAARSVIKSLPAEKYKRVVLWLDRSGVGNDPLLITQLATLAEQRDARASLAEKR